jgi:hypothetical protein
MRQRSRRPRAQASQGAARPFTGMRTRTAHAAGVDMGAHALVACVPDGEAQQSVRPCGTSPAARQTLAEGFVDRGLQTVAMASTGVSWMPRWEA